MVRTGFNPSADSLVDIAKQKAADMIDFIDAHKHMEPRLAALAITHFEEGAMCAVKCVTTPKEEQPQQGGAGQVSSYAQERRDSGPEKGA